jgi:hypothetical protein
MTHVGQVGNLRPIVNRPPCGAGNPACSRLSSRLSGITLLTLLLLASCSGPLKFGPLRIDPALESLVPSDAVFVIGANVESIRNTTVYQKHAAILNIPRFDEFAKQTGLDPRTDLSQIVSASNGKAGVLLARGKFKVADLEARLEQHGAKQTAYKGLKLFGDDTSSIVFIDHTTAMAGSTPTVKSIVDQHDQPKHGMPAALADRIRAIPPNSQIWAGLVGGISGLDLPIGRSGMLGAVLRAVKCINSMTLGIDLGNGFDLQADAVCETGGDATHLHDLMKGVIGFGRLSTPDNHPELLRLYDDIKVAQDKNRVIVSAHLPPDLVEKFLDLWLKRK